MILLVEYDALYREQLRRLLVGGPECDVVSLAEPAAAETYLNDNVRLLISRIYFPDVVGNRDYDSAAAFFRHARERIGPELPIIGLTANPIDSSLDEILKRHNFPLEVRLFDIVATRPRLLLKEAEAALQLVESE
jgi:hypothetical protein